ncbi:unnamed protein product [Clavelina lepadiformis]|uniref:BPL/LPL catalytic domain-containing protein n=1 Tax=Clavelina lepadiformis TaxID=159417 RepID=A0ABP0FKY9_CLALP
MCARGLLRNSASNYFKSPARRKSTKKCIVYTTKATDPYQNLAFEDWMYEKVDFSSSNCLFIWRNEPSVIIGRHQNPWKECPVTDLLRREIHICRRRSGGGAVYHDLGNINFTFFSDRSSYDRCSNLRVIVAALQQLSPNLDVAINKRDDIILNDRHKISGSSSKLGRRSTYHHCTMLLDANKTQVIKTLSAKIDITCKATSSVRSSVLNLVDADNHLTFDLICNKVVDIYQRKHASSEVYEISTNDEKLLPGVGKYREELSSWEWIFGKTPEFSLKREFLNEALGKILIQLHVKKGFIENVEIIPGLDEMVAITTFLQTRMVGCRFSSQDLTHLLSSLVPPLDQKLYRSISDNILSFLQ